MLSKLSIKRMTSAILAGAGVHSLVERLCLPGKAFVLMYHRILVSAASQPYLVLPGMYVSKSSFEKQMAFLQSRFEVVFLEDLVEKLSKGENIGGCCAITFDDGWLDNYAVAFPILKEYRVPATIFLATGFVGTERVFWPEEMCFCLARVSTNLADLDDAPASVHRLCQETGKFIGHSREMFFDRTIEILKRYASGERAEILRYFRSKLKTGPLPRQILNWEEVREMHAGGLVRFGAHTVNHEILDQLAHDVAREEISESRLEIKRHIGGTVGTFAYPNGNNNEKIKNLLSEDGCVAAVTTHKGFLASGVPLFEIPRIAMHEDVSNSIPMFRSRILLKGF